MKKVLVGYWMIAMLGMVLTAVGCGSMGAFQGDRGARLAVQYAVFKYTQGDADRIERVRGAVDKAFALLEADGQSTIPSLKDAFLRQVDLTKLDPADQFLAMAIIDTVVLELENRVGDGSLDSQMLLSVREVLRWVKRSPGMV